MLYPAEAVIVPEFIIVGLKALSAKIASPDAEIVPEFTRVTPVEFLRSTPLVDSLEIVPEFVLVFVPVTSLADTPICEPALIVPEFVRVKSSHA